MVFKELCRIINVLQVGKYAKSNNLKKNKTCCAFQDLEMEIKFKIKLSKVIFLVGLKSGCIQGTLMGQASCFSCLSTFLSLVIRRWVKLP